MVQAGDLVWRNKDPAVEAQARATYESLSSAEMRKVPVDATVSGALGQVWHCPPAVIHPTNHPSQDAEQLFLIPLLPSPLPVLHAAFVKAAVSLTYSATPEQCTR